MTFVPGLGDVPDHWAVKRARWLMRRQHRAVEVGDEIVTAFRDGAVVRRSARRTEGFTEAVQEVGYHGCRRGDLAVHAMDGFAGAIGVAQDDGKVSPVVHLYRPDAGDADTRYLAYTLRRIATGGYVQSLAKGIRERSTAFDASALADVLLPFPSVAEQRRIADFLDEQLALLDRAIALRQRQLQLLPEMTRAAIREAVAGGVGSEGPAEAPWVATLHERGRLQPLARTLTLQRGVDLTADQRRPGPYPVLTTAGENGHHDSYIVSGPGVVIGRYGSVGSVFWVDSPHWPHNTTLYVRDYKGNDQRYVYYLLKAYPYERLQARAAVPGVNRNDMAPDLMPWLPVSLQRGAVAECDEAEDGQRRASAVLQRHLSLLQERKQALVTACVAGQLDVTTARSVSDVGT